METSDWLSLLAVVLSIYSIYLGIKAERHANQISHAQRAAHMLLTTVNCQIRMNSVARSVHKRLRDASLPDETRKILENISSLISESLEDIEFITNELKNPEYIPLVKLEKLIAKAQVIEKKAEDISSRFETAF